MATKVERVPSFIFLGTHISQDLTWPINTTSLVKKAQKQLYSVTTLRKTNLSKQLLVSPYHCSIESILKENHQISQTIISTHLPVLEDIYSTQCLHQSTNISHIPLRSPPPHLLPSRKCYTSIKIRTSRAPSTIRELLDTKQLGNMYYLVE